MRPEDVAGALVAVRDGLVAARRCGLAVAADPRWTVRHRKAEMVEWVLADHLVRAPALAGGEVTLVDPSEVTERLTGPGADAGVIAIIVFSQTAETVLRTAGDHAQAWENRAVCRHCTLLARELREAWNGEHPTYRFRPPE
ncbi:hypothetical protein [Amycolatopsis anabasis]|uniref:hypothetical protein n=1 Tax=Amycolatopsis anabasis TaxID=1840409 RepID=UPI00131B32EC|nr:hypothetical protein [Amycolatopsis anabasis]